MPRRGRGGACCGVHGGNGQAGADGAALDGERVEQWAAASRTTAPGSQAKASRRLGQAGERGRDGGANPRNRGVDLAPAGRGGDVEGTVAVVSDRSQLWLPAPGEQRASRQQNRRGGAFARADGERKLRRAEAGAPRQARSWSRRGSGRRACACAPAACAPVSRARALRQGRPKAARCMRGCR